MHKLDIHLIKVKNANIMILVYILKGGIIMLEEKEINLELLELHKSIVKLENVFVDPNNPRLLEMGFEEVPDDRIEEEDVQKEAIANMKKIGLKDIIEKVKKFGFLTVDRVVVRSLNKGKFVVLEGNRRVSSLKVLKVDHARGRVSINERVLKSIDEFEVLIYKGADKDVVWLLQGLRHIKGIKDWGPVQQGRFLVEMQERRNLKPTDLATMTGLGRNTIANLIRSYKGWEQAKEDDDYGDKVDTDKFSLFQEAIFKKSSLKKWLGWDDNNKKFENRENFKKLLGWYLGDENTNNGEPRLPRVNPDVRDVLSKLLIDKNKSIFEEFENGDISIDKARSKMEEDEYRRDAQEIKVDLDSQLENLDLMTTTLQTLPIPKIIKNNEKISPFIKKLESVEDAAKTQKNIIITMKSKRSDDEDPN